MQLIPMSLVRWTLYLFVDMSSSATKYRRHDFLGFYQLVIIFLLRIDIAILNLIYIWISLFLVLSCNKRNQYSVPLLIVVSLFVRLFLYFSISSSCICLCPSPFLFLCLSLLFRWRSTQKVDLTRSLASPRHQKHLKRLSIWLEGKALWLLLVCLQVWYYEKRQGYLAAVTVL